MLEDSEDDILLIMRHLKKSGYNPLYEKVQTADTIKKALQERKWDIILCDYTMPKFSASAAIALLKKLKIDIPIIIVSGTIGEEKAIECMRSGAHDYIMKSNLSRLAPAIVRELKQTKVRKKQKRTEEKLYKEKQLFRTLAEQSSDIIVLVDSEGKVVYENPAVAVSLGLKPEERIGKNVFEMLHPDDLKDVKDSFTALFRDKNLTLNRKREVRLHHRDGSWRTFEIAASNLVRNDVIEAVIVNLRDITERKQVEGALFERERQYKLIAEKMTDIIWIADIDLNLSYITPSVYQVLGFTQEEAKKQTLEEKLTPDSLAYGMEVLARELDIEKKGRGDANRTVNIELEYYHKDGSTRWLESIISGLRDDQGVLTGLHGVVRDVTSRKESQDALRTSEEKFLKAFRYNPSAMSISTVSEGRYIDVNHAYLKTFGYQREEIIGRTSTDINLWVDLAERNAMIRGLAETGKVNNIELRTRDKQGNIHWLLTSASLIKTGGESYLLTQSVDVTDRKRAAEALNAANKQLQDIIEFLPDATLIVDKDNKLIAWNRAIEEMTGIPKAAIIGQDYHQASIPFYGEVRPFLMDLVGMDDAELAAKYSNVRRVGSAVHAEVFTPALYDNRGAHVLAVASPLLDDAGNIVGLIESIRDITLKKQAELQRESALESLRQSEELYTKLVNSIPDVIVQTDLEGNVIFVNDKTLHISGYSREEMIGRKLHSFVSPEYREEALKNKQLMLENKAGPREYNLLAKDGRKIPFDINGDVLRNEEGRPYGFVNVCRDISERKRVAKELHEQEERLQSINQNLPGVIYQFYARDDGEYGFSYISEPLDEFSKMVIGDTPPNLDTFFESFFLRVCEEDRERLLLSIKKAVDTVSPWNFEGRVSESSGELIWFQGFSVPKRLDDRVIFNGILLNINERKLAEEKSRQSEEKFHKIFMTTPNAASLTRLRDGLLIDVNKSFVNIIGSTRAEVIGRNVTEPPLNFWVDPSERDLMVAELKSGKDIVQGELKFRRYDGTERFGIYATRPINIDGEECLIFILQDVTERRQAEEKFRKIFMTSPDLVGITRLKDGLITDVNKGFENISGWKREEAIGTKSSEPPLSFWVVAADRELMVTDLKAGRDITHREIKFRRKDGSIGIGIYSARPMNVDGEDSLIFIMQDITEQKRMEKELALSEKMKLMGQLASGVAHEVRNPLHAIQAISEAMAIDVDEKSDYKEYLTHIKAQVARLSHLMNDLLELSKPIQPSQLSKVLVAEIATEALRNWLESHYQLSQQIKIVNKLKSDDVVMVNLNKVQQVIINLLDNAVQHSSRDEEIFLEVDKTSENYIMIKIVDKGMGMKSEDHSRVFEPFYTTRKSGTGLGLSICKHIIESHGGAIALVNNENAPGCTAWFTLPVCSDKEH